MAGLLTGALLAACATAADPMPAPTAALTCEVPDFAECPDGSHWRGDGGLGYIGQVCVRPSGDRHGPYRRQPDPSARPLPVAPRQHQVWGSYRNNERDGLWLVWEKTTRGTSECRAHTYREGHVVASRDCSCEAWLER